MANTAGTRYFRIGACANAGLRIDYAVTDRIDVGVGVGGRNLLDDTYQFADGFPEAGRSVFASLRARC